MLSPTVNWCVNDRDRLTGAIKRGPIGVCLDLRLLARSRNVRILVCRRIVPGAKTSRLYTWSGRRLTPAASAKAAMAMPVNEHPRCKICNGTTLIDLGQVVHAHPTRVAGIELDLGSQEFHLIACAECEFQMKDPPIPEGKLLECYEKSTIDHWEEDPDPYVRRFDLLRNLIEKHAHGRRVLDIGCFNGSLLSYLGNSWDKFGVEPSAAAAELATSRGIRILGKTLDDVKSESSTFDVVMAIDVAEHLFAPLQFFRDAASLLKPGGLMLIGTGNVRSFSWRMQQSLYYYCRFPEHISFYSRRTMDHIADQLSMTCRDYRTLSHKRLSTARFIREAIKNSLYLAVCRTKGLGVPGLYSYFRRLRGPSFLSSRDHMIYLFERNHD